MSFRPSETAQQMKVFAKEPDNLSSNPEPYIVEGKTRLLEVVLWDPLCAETPPFSLPHPQIVNEI